MASPDSSTTQAADERKFGDDESTVGHAQAWQVRPDEKDILRQMEHYFSDENLIQDAFLYQAMNGNANDPVPIKTIHGFPRMRRYKPKSDIAKVLKLSKTLEVVADSSVKRKVPFQWPETNGLGDSTTNTIEKDTMRTSIDREAEKPHPVLSSDGNQGTRVKIINGPKVNGPVGLTKGMAQPSGFEEYFADPPITPDQFVEERRLYDPEEAVFDRIETALRRYSCRRRFRNANKNAFDSFLRFGGIIVEPNHFGGGLTKEDMAGMTKDEITMAKCPYRVLPECRDKSQFVLDLESVAKGFFSSVIPSTVTSSQYTKSIPVIANFYRYLLHHDVFCPSQEPELVADVRRSLKVCKSAELELPLVGKAMASLPGHFATAVSVLTGGYHAGLWVGDTTWVDENGSEIIMGQKTQGGNDINNVGMSDKHARIIALFNLHRYMPQNAIAAASLGPQWYSHLKVIRECHQRLEVVGSEQVRTAEELNATSSDSDGLESAVMRKLNLRPLSKLICKSWTYDDFVPVDGPARDEQTSDTEFQFLIEENLARLLLPGMKIEALIRRITLDPTSCRCSGSPHEKITKQLDATTDFWQIDRIDTVRCSFFTYLKNELVSKPQKVIRYYGKGLQESQLAKHNMIQCER